MSKLVWDGTGNKRYETGVDKGVVYPINNQGIYTPGVAWNGLTSVSESPSGAEATALYADNIKYLNLYSAEEFGATIEAYTYPDEFALCDGSASIASGVTIGQQTRKIFGLCYKTLLGNDVEAQDFGYKLHLIYGCMASPSEKGYQTVNDSPEAITFSWEITTTPVNVTGFKPTASIVIDSTTIPADKLAALEDILYGTNSSDPRLPLPDEIATLVGTADSYAVNNYLTNVTTSNDAAVATETYDAILTADEGYTIANVVVTMGGVDVTTVAYTSGTGAISIASVNGPIVIFATANNG